MDGKDTFPKRFTRIDDLTRPDHPYLRHDDECYFIGEYTARKGFAYSATNRLIWNFKKTMDRRELPEWRYKNSAIQTTAVAFRRALTDEALDQLTFVPVPPSKAKGDPLYDDRMTQMLRAIRPQPPLDIREIVQQTQSTEAVHGHERRPTPRKIEDLYRIDQALAAPEPATISVVDDVLTTGAHFRAMKNALSPIFPGVRIIGLFIARVERHSSLDDIAGI